ncbi:hypothetical protein [Jiella sp. M17.18]|uniref:hypothetical protein n=1 Tax=Jiella sp. M17.18 TaxID=3234247 RepID=UPI0034E0548E
MTFDFSAVSAVLGDYRKPPKRRGRSRSAAKGAATKAGPKAEAPPLDHEPVTGSDGHGVLGLEDAIGTVFDVANPAIPQAPADAGPGLSCDGYKAAVLAEYRIGSEQEEPAISRADLSQLRFEDLIDALANAPDPVDPVPAEPRGESLVQPETPERLPDDEPDSAEDDPVEFTALTSLTGRIRTV